MNVEQLKWWNFDKKLNDNSEIQCPDCKQFNHISKWTENENSGCELCGSHACIRCPNCEEDFDHISHETFKTQ